MRPSQYLRDVSLDTEKKLASQTTVKIPKQLELLEMPETSHYKVNKLSIHFSEAVLFSEVDVVLNHLSEFMTETICAYVS